MKLADQIVAMKETIVTVSEASNWVAKFCENDTVLYVSFPTLLAKNGCSDGGTNMSSTGNHFLAGILEHLTALCIISRGVAIHAGDLSTALRPRQDPLTQTMSIQYCLCDSSFNPYITLASVFACGMEGIRNETKLKSTGEQQRKAPKDDTQEIIQSACLSSDEFLLSILGPSFSKGHLKFREAEEE